MLHLLSTVVFLFSALLLASPAFAENRVALVIGNGAYRHAPRLINPPNDAEGVAAALKRANFETILALDLDKAGMEEAAIRFARAARNADVAMFYYSGHAIQYAATNYLIPIEAKLNDEADLRRLMRVDDIVADLLQARNLRILVLDACRDNPLAEELKRSIGTTRSLPLQRGLAKIDSPQGMIVAYATQAGRTADDGHGRNSPYTAALLKHIETHEEIGTVFRRVTADVYETTKRTQLPELSLSLIGEFYLKGRLDLTIPTTPSVDPCAAAGDHWKSAEAIGTIASLEDHLARFPNCAFAGLARAKIETLKVAIVPPPASTPRIPNIQPTRRIEFHGYDGPAYIEGYLALQPDGTWVETNTKYKDLYFNAVSDTKRELLLYDRSRDLYLRVSFTENHIYWRQGAKGSWNRLYRVARVLN